MLTIIAALCLLLLASLLADAGELPSGAVPDGLGVNIHFTGEPARDLDLIQAGGFKFVRMDIHWQRVEKEKGVYDFTVYDELTNGLAKRGIRPLFILCYGHPLYETDLSVRTPEGRQAFARYAAAVARRYRGRGFLWELWNEPNGDGFWKPQPDVNQYMALAQAVLPAIREADPDALRVAPATSGIPFDFLEQCFRQGLLKMVEGVTVHPYRHKPPETVIPDILRLRALIARYRPDRPDLPVLSGEWGYSTAWEWFDPGLQGRYLARQFLTNLSLGIPLSIWYDWHDDGPDPKEYEHNFGTVTNDYQPKPAYLEMQRLTEALRGMRFVKRLQSAPEDFLLLFSDDRRRTIAAWTTGDEHEAEPIPGHKVALTGDPQYLPVPADAHALLADGAWTVSVRSGGVRGGAAPGEPLAPEFETRVINPFSEPIKVRLASRGAKGLTGRFAEGPGFELAVGEARTLHWRGRAALRGTGQFAVTVIADIGGWRSKQQVQFMSANPIGIEAARRPDGRVTVLLTNPAGEAFDGALEAQAGTATVSYAVQLAHDSPFAQVTPLPGANAGAVDIAADQDTLHMTLPLTAHPNERVRVTLRQGASLVAQDVVRFVPLSVTARDARAVVRGEPAAARLDLSDAGPGAVRLSYDIEAGEALVAIVPARKLQMPGRPQQIGVWVRGEGSYAVLRQRFTDRTGRTFQPCFGGADFTGWRYLTAPLDDPWLQSWGEGGEPNQIAYPLRMDSFLVLDPRRRALKGALELSGFHLIYRR